MFLCSVPGPDPNGPPLLWLQPEKPARFTALPTKLIQPLGAHRLGAVHFCSALDGVGVQDQGYQRGTDAAECQQPDCVHPSDRQTCAQGVLQLWLLVKWCWSVEAERGSLC